MAELVGAPYLGYGEKSWGFKSLYPYNKSKNKLSCSVIGNTSDFGSEDSKFDSWQDNNITQQHPPSPQP